MRVLGARVFRELGFRDEGLGVWVLGFRDLGKGSRA